MSRDTAPLTYNTAMTVTFYSPDGTASVQAPRKCIYCGALCAESPDSTYQHQCIVGASHAS